MNRLAPLIHRADPRPGPARLAAVGAAPASVRIGLAPGSGLADDLRLFLTSWLGGLIFFGTMLA
jgi:hypothetical protein